MYFYQVIKQIFRKMEKFYNDKMKIVGIYVLDIGILKGSGKTTARTKMQLSYHMQS